MKKFLLFIWELPQTLVGWFLVLILSKGKRKRISKSDSIYMDVYEVPLMMAVCFGRICLLGKLFGEVYEQHEFGHRLQSARFGWLYLFSVGIVSITRNFYFQTLLGETDYNARQKWYYGSWPENAADRLGGVVWVNGKRELPK